MQCTAVVGDLSVPPKSFALGRALSRAPDVVVELEEIVPVGDQTAPYFWVRGALDEFESAVRDDGDVASLERTVTVEETELFRLTWRDLIPDLLAHVADTEGTGLRATGRDGEWLFTIRFPDGDSLSAFHGRCADDGVSFDVERLKHL